MKTIAVLLLLASQIMSQDVLILKTGIKYTGKYERSTEDLIYFIQEGNKFASGVPKDQIDIVILEDGTVVDTGGDITEKKLDKAGKRMEEIKFAKIGPDTKVNLNLEIRQTEALERIAMSTTGIFYLMVAGTVVAILTYIKYLDEIKDLKEIQG